MHSEARENQSESHSLGNLAEEKSVCRDHSSHCQSAIVYMLVWTSLAIRVRVPGTKQISRLRLSPSDNQPRMKCERLHHKRIIRGRKDRERIPLFDVLRTPRKARKTGVFDKVSCQRTERNYIIYMKISQYLRQ